jgi:hypothetical protein
MDAYGFTKNVDEIKRLLGETTLECDGLGCKRRVIAMTEHLSNLERAIHLQSVNHQVSLTLVQDAHRCDEVSRRCNEARIHECQTLLWQKSEGCEGHNFALAQSAVHNLAESMHELDPFDCAISRDLQALNDKITEAEREGRALEP